MRLFGFEIKRAENARPVHPTPRWNGEFGVVRESFPGAWQHNVELSTESKLAFAAVFACVRLISSDISKLRMKLTQLKQGVWQEVETFSPFAVVLRKPNRYQTRIQFLEQWMISKLLHGNTYVLKVRDDRNLVNELHVLDAQCVTPLVTETGEVYYEIKRDDLATIVERVIVSASDIIHDRHLPLWHPLMGVSPLYASAISAKQGTKIQENSEQFFANMSRPSGVLTSPNPISSDTAKRLKEGFEANFGGANIGRVLVAGDGLKYEAMTIPAASAQLIEQLEWSGEDVARAFGVPPHKIGLGAPPTFNNIAQLNQQYYSETLQQPMESIELLLDEGLGLVAVGYGVTLDLDNLLRLDPLTRADIGTKRVGAGLSSPNEERAIEDRAPVKGGEEPFMQQQMFPLRVLATREFPEVAPTPAPTAPPAPAGPKPRPADERMARELADALINRFVAELA